MSSHEPRLAGFTAAEVLRMSELLEEVQDISGTVEYGLLLARAQLRKARSALATARDDLARAEKTVQEYERFLKEEQENAPLR